MATPILVQQRQHRTKMTHVNLKQKKKQKYKKKKTLDRKPDQITA